MASNIKSCKNPDCTIINPKFYNNGSTLCRKCYAKKYNGVQRDKQRKKNEEYKKKDEELENLKKTIELLTSQLSQVQVHTGVETPENQETSEDSSADPV